MFRDLTKILSNESFVYPGDPETQIKRVFTIKKDGYNLSEIKSSLHTSTHIDFPAHFIENGKTSSDFDDINYFTGKVLIIDLKDFPVKKAENFDSVFIKTHNEKDKFLKNCNSISLDNLEFLIKNKIKFIGTDFYTIEPCLSRNFLFHKELLKNNILIIENLFLEEIENGIYEYFIFPVKIYNVEACFCRVAVKI